MLSVRKRGVLLASLYFLTILTSVVGTLFTPTPVVAAGEKFVFYYNDSDPAAKRRLIQELRNGENYSGPEINDSKIIVENGPGAKTSVLNYDPETTNKYNDKGAFGDTDSGEYFFTKKFYCAVDKKVVTDTVPSGTGQYLEMLYTVGLAIDGGDGANEAIDKKSSYTGGDSHAGVTKTLRFTPSNAGGQAASDTIYDHREGGAGVNDVDDDSDKINPSECRPKGRGNITILNYGKLSAADKEKFKGIGGDFGSGGAGGTGTGANGGTGNAEAATDNCGGFGFAWIVCSGIQATTDIVAWVERNFIIPFLDVQPLSFGNNAENPMYGVWEAIRNLANGFLVIIFIIIIFSTTLSLNVNAYTIKKMLPKLVVAAILIQASYLLCAVAIDVTNVFGKGLFLLSNSILPGYSDTNLSEGEALLGIGLTGLVTAVAGIAIFGAGIVSIGFILLLAVIGVFAVFATLVFRQVLITALVIISPIAIACWILPNTESFFKKWLDNFIKVLLMYPLIVLLFAAGKLFATAVSQNDNGLAPAFALAGLVMPLIMVPGTFKAAGSLMDKGTGYIDKGDKKLRGGMKGSDFKKNLDTQRKLRLQGVSDKGGALGYLAGASQGRIFGKGEKIGKVPLIGKSIEAAAAGAANRARLKGIDAAGDQLKGLGATAGDLQKILAGKATGAFRAYNNSPVAKMAAARYLGEKGLFGAKEYADLHNSDGVKGNKGVMDATRRMLTSGDAGSKLRESNPALHTILSNTSTSDARLAINDDGSFNAGAVSGMGAVDAAGKPIIDSSTGRQKRIGDEIKKNVGSFSADKLAGIGIGGWAAINELNGHESIDATTWERIAKNPGLKSKVATGNPTIRKALEDIERKQRASGTPAGTASADHILDILT